MTSFQERFCNTHSDLYSIEPNIDSFQPKRNLYNAKFVATGVTHQFVYYGSGYVGNLFVDGENLEDNKQTSIGAVTSDHYWYYDNTKDALYFYNSQGNPTSHVFDAGEDWEDYKARVCNEMASRIISFIDRPIYKRKGTGEQGAELRDYDWCLIYSNASLAVAEIIRGFDPERADQIESRIIDPVEKIGLLDRLKSGEYKLWNEITLSERSGAISEVSVNASTTGTIIDTRGRPSGAVWDSIRVEIAVGGTITRNSDNDTVKYSVYVKGEKGLGTEIVIDTELINCDYQSLAYGMTCRFSPGTYNTGDQWAIEVSSDQVDKPRGVRSAQMIRT